MGGGGAHHGKVWTAGWEPGARVLRAGSPPLVGQGLEEKGLPQAEGWEEAGLASGGPGVISSVFRCYHLNILRNF